MKNKKNINILTKSRNDHKLCLLELAKALERANRLEGLIDIILQADMLKAHAFEKGDEEYSVHELCRKAVREE